jgi:hypothetical protein
MTHNPALPAVDAEAPIAKLVGEVYRAAAPVDRSRLLAVLMRPLGLLSLAAVSGGLFTAIRVRNGLDSLQVRLEDTLNIRVPDVTALADMVQQVDADAFDALGRLLSTTPALAGTTAAVLLLRALNKRRSSAV